VRHRLLVAALLALATALGSTAASASSPGGLKLRPVKSTFPERTFVLTLPKGEAVGPAGIRLEENGSSVDNLAVTPTSFGGFVLVIDTSLSMEGRRIEAAMEAARAFARQRQPHEKLAVVTFAAEPRVLLPFTTNTARIDEALSTTPPLRYFTRTNDALVTAAKLVSAEQLRSPAIVLVSDGEELGSTVTRAAAVDAVRRAGIRVFSVGLVTGPRGTAALRQLSFDTGGTSVRADSPDSVVGIYEQLGYELSNGYLVQYRSFAGPSEKVTVTISAPGVDGTAMAAYTSPPLTSPLPAAIPGLRAEQATQSRTTMLFVAVLVAGLLGIAVAALVRPSKSALRRRLGAFVSLAGEEPSKRQTTALTEKLLASTDQSLGRTRWWDKFKHQLVVAQISVPAEQVIVLTIIGTLFVGWLMYLLIGTAAAILALGLPFAVRWLIAFRAERERRLFGDQLADNLQVISSALRAGHSFVGALSVMVEEAPEPSRREFRRVVADEQLGVPLDESLQIVGERMRCRDLEQVAMVAALQRETGGNSADVLDQVAENIRERGALRRLVRTLTAQGRLARWIVSFLPVAVLLMIMVMNRSYMDPLFEKTSGRVMLGFAAAMVVAGSLVIRKIVDIKV
jgi:tight adherence protein B